MRFTTMLTRMFALVGAGALVVALAGCAGPAPAGPNTEHNNADISFAQQMIPHHQQALLMAEMGVKRAASEPVKQLVAAIQRDQQPEIDQMTGMLLSWHAPVLATGGQPDMPGMAGMSGMPGMMGDDEMRQLGQLTGAAFDKQFLTMMITHHQGAVDMSAVELRDGQSPPAKQLARRITDAQNAQISQMRGLLATG
jgi:uncharacterized protein (DUF305 family)